MQNQPPSPSVASNSHCKSLTEEIDNRMRRLWMPGKRETLIAESYDAAFACKEAGAIDLAKTNFQRAISLASGLSERNSRHATSLGIAAACHNHLGLLELDLEHHEASIPYFDSAIELRKLLRTRVAIERENQVYLGGALCNRAIATSPTDPKSARAYFEASLHELQQPKRTCECSYWDEPRNSWWCEQLEAMGDAMNLPWVSLAPLFIDSAMEGLKRLDESSLTS